MADNGFIDVVFLLDKINPGLSYTKYLPLILIGAGLWFLFGRKNNQNLFSKKNKFQKNFGSFTQNETSYTQTSQNDNSLNDGQQNTSFAGAYIESVAVFGGAKRSISIKSFKVCKISSVFGGSEINFSHADINGVVFLDNPSIWRYQNYCSAYLRFGYRNLTNFWWCR